jgi:hypothetical protein
MRFLAIFLLAGMLHAAPASMSFKWNELSGAIVFKEVIVDLKDGSSVKGEVGSVEPSALEIYVSKTGPVSISRDSIASVRLIKMGKIGRRLGLTGGILVGLVGGTALFLDSGLSPLGSTDSGPQYHPTERVLGTAVIVGLPWAGYFIGRKLEPSHEIRITILPD